MNKTESASKPSSTLLPAHFGTRGLVTGIYAPFFSDPVMAKKAEKFFFRRQIDQRSINQSASFGEAALRQALSMADTGKTTYRDFLATHDLFRRHPSPKEQRIGNDFLALQAGFFQKLSCGQDEKTACADVGAFAQQEPVIYLWSTIKNNLLKPAADFRYDDTYDLMINLYRAEIALSIADGSYKARQQAAAGIAVMSFSI